jgi:CRP-like cAMP-binding protein
VQGSRILPNSNLLLAALSRRDLDLIQPHLKPVHLEQRQVLYATGDEVDIVYFPSTAVISLVAELSGGEMVEAAMVGRDGVIGGACALDGKISLSRAIVQLGGDAMMCGVDVIKSAAQKSPSVLAILIRHEQTVYAQAQQSAACMATHHVDARLCRWLLRARDLSGSDVLPFTQEFLGEMLGVRRTSVSVVAHTLQQAGMLKYVRGKIQITNVDSIRQTACECYAAIRSNYEGLLGKVPPA